MDRQEPNDEELINRFYQADGEALKMIFQRHKEGLFNFALRFTGNRADAEDAVSHTFMMVCEKKYTTSPEARFKTWAYTVVRNTCLSKLRLRTKFYPLWAPKKDSDLEEPIQIVDQKALTRDRLNDKEIHLIIQKAIAKLAEEQKEALLLREYQGFSYLEISQVLNCSVDKVKVLIFRARHQLKELLGPVLLEEGR